MNFSKSIYELMLGVMKNQLKLAEFRFGGKESDSFKFFKEQTMNHFYDALKKFYLDGVKDGAFSKCSCGANLRKGWKDCSCGGSGFIDSTGV